RRRLSIGGFGDSLVLFGKAEIVRIRVTDTPSVTRLLGEPQKEGAHGVQGLGDGGLAQRLATARAGGAIERTSKRNRLLTMKLLERAEAGGLLETVDSGCAHVHTGLAHATGMLQV